MSKYSGMLANRIVPAGGAVRVTTSSNVGQGNGGTSLACKGCFVNCPSTNGNSVCKVNIGAAASWTLGIDIAQSAGSRSAGQALFIPIDDVAKLYFYSDDDGAAIDILYLLG